MKKNKLIKVILLSAFITVPVFSSMAQNAGSALSFGAKLGISSSGFTHHGEVFTYKKMGATLGAFGEFKVNELFGVSAELNYLQVGAFHLDPSYVYPNSVIYKYSGPNYLGMRYSDVKLHTIEIPIMATIRPGMDGNITPKVTLGFSFDFILKARSKNLYYEYTSVDSYSSTLPNRESDDVSSSFKSFNCGPVGGLGLDFKTKGFTYTIEARYFIGLNRINNLAELNNGSSNNDRFYFSSNALTITLAVGLQ